MSKMSLTFCLCHAEETSINRDLESIAKGRRLQGPFFDLQCLNLNHLRQAYHAGRRYVQQNYVTRK